MPPTISTDIDRRYLPGLLLILFMLASWFAGLKNLVLGWPDVADKNGTASRPNILLIVADDLGYDDTSVINTTGLATPNLERLARQGVTFRRHYADSTCTPSRVAMLTGRYPERSGFRPTGIEIPPEFPTLAQQLQQAGYATYLTGKWHAGEERRQAWPEHKGFDHWFGFLNQFELSGAGERENEAIGVQPTYNQPMLRRDGGPQEKYPGHLTDILTDHTIATLRELQAADKPWFLYHAFLAPHTPIQPERRYRERFPKTREGKYTALVTQLDDAIGRLLDAVDQDNTLVIFLSDNGGPNSHRDNNFPFFGRKDQPLEGAYRTPLIISWPGRIPAGTTVDDVVMNVDIFPTVLQAVGAAAPAGLDGSSLLDLMTTGTPLAERGRSWESFHPAINALSYSYLSATGEWRQSSRQGVPPNLFNLQQDPTGHADVAAAHPAIVDTLSSEYWRTHWDKSHLGVTERPGAAPGQTLYSGFDAQRTPWLQGFSIGLELGPFAPEAFPDNGEAYVLAGQVGSWELRYRPGQGLEWHIGASVLRDTTFDPGRCNAVILAGYIQKLAHLARRKPFSVVKLYSGGYLRALDDDFEMTPVDDAVLAAPTAVNHGGRALFSSIMLGSYDDPYEPRTDSPFLPAIVELYREKRLTMPEVAMMDSRLCHAAAP